MHATGWKKQLTVKQPGGAEKALRSSPTFLNLSLGYKMWSPNSPAPPPPPSVFVFRLPPSASEWKSGLTGTYHSPPTGQIIWLSKGRLPHFENLELPASPAVFSVSGLARGGEERLEGGSEEESVRTAF